MPVVTTGVGKHTAWILETAHSSMVLRLGSDDALFMPHWGASRGNLLPADDLPNIPLSAPTDATSFDGQPLAYTWYGLPTFKEPALVVAAETGARTTRFRYVADRLSRDGNALDLTFKDALLDLELTLVFQIHPEMDVIARRATLTNTGRQNLLVERAASATLPLPPHDYDVLALTGQWGREFQLTQQPLLAGRLGLGSTRGLSSHEAHPWFAIRPRDERDENLGRVWFGSLAWSGNWQLVIEVEPDHAINIVMGIQWFDFTWRLEPGDSFQTPELVCGYSESGLGGASRSLHAYEERVQLPAEHRQASRPVLYNSWEATHFDVTIEGQLALAHRAAEMGIELFVVDDGWFGERNDDTAGLGDWTVHRTKFPHGLRPLINAVHALGMQFGIWVEPEMVSPDSELYRHHPDWAYHAEGREPTLGRNQMVLNFARADVREAIHQQLRRLLSEHGRIDYIKWDHNRPWTEVGWPENSTRQREVWVRHILGLYDVLERLRGEFPGVLFEACAGGGGRADLGMLRWTDQVWTSDNTDAADRLAIQYGFSRAHTPRVMVGWVTDVPNQQTGRTVPLEFRFHVAMQGVLGVGGDITRWSAAELAEARALVAQYKEIRPLVQHGRQYWLDAPAAVGPCAVQYVATDGSASAVFLYQMRSGRGRGRQRIRLRGLNPEVLYRRQADGVESTGAALMTIGVPAALEFRDGSPSLDYLSRLDVWRDTTNTPRT